MFIIVTVGLTIALGFCFILDIYNLSVKIIMLFSTTSDDL